MARIDISPYIQNLGGNAEKAISGIYGQILVNQQNSETLKGQIDIDKVFNDYENKVNREMYGDPTAADPSPSNKSLVEYTHDRDELVKSLLANLPKVYKNRKAVDNLAIYIQNKGSGYDTVLQASYYKKTRAENEARDRRSLQDIIDLNWAPEAYVVGRQLINGSVAAGTIDPVAGETLWESAKRQIYPKDSDELKTKVSDLTTQVVDGTKTVDAASSELELRLGSSAAIRNIDKKDIPQIVKDFKDGVAVELVTNQAMKVLTGPDGYLASDGLEKAVAIVNSSPLTEKQRMAANEAISKDFTLSYNIQQNVFSQQDQNVSTMLSNIMYNSKPFAQVIADIANTIYAVDKARPIQKGETPDAFAFHNPEAKAGAIKALQDRSIYLQAHLTDGVDKDKAGRQYFLSEFTTMYNQEYVLKGSEGGIPDLDNLVLVRDVLRDKYVSHDWLGTDEEGQLLKLWIAFDGAVDSLQTVPNTASGSFSKLLSAENTAVDNTASSTDVFTRYYEVKELMKNMPTLKFKDDAEAKDYKDRLQKVMGTLSNRIIDNAFVGGMATLERDTRFMDTVVLGQVTPEQMAEMDQSWYDNVRPIRNFLNSDMASNIGDTQRKELETALTKAEINHAEKASAGSVIIANQKMDKLDRASNAYLQASNENKEQAWEDYVLAFSDFMGLTEADYMRFIPKEQQALVSSAKARSANVVISKLSSANDAGATITIDSGFDAILGYMWDTQSAISAATALLESKDVVLDINDRDKITGALKKATEQMASKQSEFISTEITRLVNGLNLRVANAVTEEDWSEVASYYREEFSPGVWGMLNSTGLQGKEAGLLGKDVSSASSAFLTEWDKRQEASIKAEQDKNYWSMKGNASAWDAAVADFEVPGGDKEDKGIALDSAYMKYVRPAFDNLGAMDVTPGQYSELINGAIAGVKTYIQKKLELNTMHVEAFELWAEQDVTTAVDMINKYIAWGGPSDMKASFDNAITNLQTMQASMPDWYNPDPVLSAMRRDPWDKINERISAGLLAAEKERGKKIVAATGSNNEAQKAVALQTYLDALQYIDTTPPLGFGFQDKKGNFDFPAGKVVTRDILLNWMAANRGLFGTDSKYQSDVTYVREYNSDQSTIAKDSLKSLFSELKFTDAVKQQEYNRSLMTMIRTYGADSSEVKGFLETVKREIREKVTTVEPHEYLGTGIKLTGNGIAALVDKWQGTMSKKTLAGDAATTDLYEAMKPMLAAFLGVDLKALGDTGAYDNIKIDVGGRYVTGKQAPCIRLMQMGNDGKLHPILYTLVPTVDSKGNFTNGEPRVGVIEDITASPIVKILTSQQTLADIGVNITKIRGEKNSLYQNISKMGGTNWLVEKDVIGDSQQAKDLRSLLGFPTGSHPKFGDIMSAYVTRAGEYIAAKMEAPPNDDTAMRRFGTFAAQWETILRPFLVKTYNGSISTGALEWYNNIEENVKYAIKSSKQKDLELGKLMGYLAERHVWSWK